MKVRCGVFVLVGILMPASVQAQSVPLLSGSSLDALAGSLRGFLIQSLPSPLVESKQGWGNTKQVKEVKWRGQGFKVHPEVRQVAKYDGLWRKTTVWPVNLADSLIFDLRNLQQPEHGPTTFDAFVSFDARVEHERENWQSGVRLYGGSTRARFRIRLMLKCEVTSRLEKNGTLVPDMILRMRVLHSDLHYDNLVFEHVAGLGGEAAKILGDAVKGGLKQFHPSLERDLLAKANAAIVKAGDTKEVRLSLGKLLEK